MTQNNKLLLTAVFGPYGVKDKYAEALGCQMELLNNQITRCQGIHSPRQSYWSFGLYMIAENLDTPATILDFPKWEDFTKELKKGYTHVGISFIVPNVLKARRMARYVRKHYPEMKIILGGYGSVIPDLADYVPHDEVCRGEGVSWLRSYFGENVNAPIRHPALIGPAYERIYGYSTKPRGAILMPGLGCENACEFCITSHKFNKCYVPLLNTGEEIFDACRKTEGATQATGFSVMDENFLKRPERARKLLASMEQHNKPYVFDLFSSAETIRALGADFLVRLGVRMVWIGVESQSSPHGKNRGIDLKALVGELQEKGIIVQASMILFQEHHDETNIHEDIDWVIGLGSSLTQFMNYTPCPGTVLYEELAQQGRLKSIPYQRLHGQDELAFEHPNFPLPHDHVRLLRAAFRRKYTVDGPGVLNMAITLAQGVKQGWEDLRRRENEGRAWNPDTMRYEKSDASQPDRFMKRRLFMMARMASGLRPVLWAAWAYAPNMKARRKAREAMRLYAEVLGRSTTKDRVQALGLVVTGGMEFVRLWFNRLLGRESIVHQPPCHRTEYRMDRPPQPARLVDEIASSLQTIPVPCNESAAQ